HGLVRLQCWHQHRRSAGPLQLCSQLAAASAHRAAYWRLGIHPALGTDAGPLAASRVARSAAELWPAAIVTAKLARALLAGGRLDLRGGGGFGFQRRGG